MASACCPSPTIPSARSGVRLSGGRIEVPRVFDPSPSPLRLDPSAPAGLSDLSVAGEDGAPLAGHRCVLAARLEYFNMMLNSGWAEVRPERLSHSVPAQQRLG